CDHPSWARPYAPHWDIPIPCPLPDPNSVMVPAARAGEIETSPVRTVETASTTNVKRRISLPAPPGSVGNPTPSARADLRLRASAAGVRDAPMAAPVQACATSVPGGTRTLSSSTSPATEDPSPSTQPDRVAPGPIRALDPITD